MADYGDNSPPDARGTVVQPDFAPEWVMLSHGAYLFMTFKTAPWERTE